MSPSLLTKPGCNQLSPEFPQRFEGGPTRGDNEGDSKPLPNVKYPFVPTKRLDDETPFILNDVGNNIGFDVYPSSKLVKPPSYKV